MLEHEIAAVQACFSEIYFACHTVTPSGTQFVVAIREDGFVKPPLFRFFSRFVFGHTKTIDNLLDGLAR